MRCSRSISMSALLFIALVFVFLCGIGFMVWVYQSGR